jgi:outer membrane receptor for ferrienterochelin and colicin
VTPTGIAPMLASTGTGSATFTYRPIKPLKIDNTYLLERLRDRQTGQAIFNNHILQSKWNLQFTRDLSLRAIMQYNATLPDPAYTSLQTTKQFNTDFLVTYLIHPGTALYVGYNSDLQNLDRGLAVDPATGLINRSPMGYINDGRQFFVKISYLLQR